MEILYNKAGNPLMISASGYFANTTGAPAAGDLNTKKMVSVTDLTNTSRVSVGNHLVMPWGAGNNFPQDADKKISSVSVLNSGLKFLRNLTLGQGIYACTVSGIDDKGNEILKPLADTGVQDFLNSRQVRRYMEMSMRDILKFGTSAVAFLPNRLGNGFAGIQTLNAYHFRFSEADKCIVSGKWPGNPGDEYDAYDMMLDYDPALSLLDGKIDKIKVMALRDSWSNNDTYSTPIWWSAYLAGWVDIAQSVPEFLKKAYKNQISWKWHIQIPYSYWDKRFPRTEFEDDELRKAAITKHMEDIEKNLCSEANAEKPIFTMYAVNEGNGRVEEEWKIIPLDNKYKEGDKLVTSAAANSEILFSLLVNPNVMGAGMPGGAYAGNQGGSNIREAFLVNIANAWVDRQMLLDPIELYLRTNGVKNAEIRFKNTILTTLDTGAGTTKTLS